MKKPMKYTPPGNVSRRFAGSEFSQLVVICLYFRLCIAIPMGTKKATWQELVNKDRPFVLPGAYDALSVKLIEQQGFEGLVVGGFSLVGSRYGIPDIGLAGLDEMSVGMKDIIEATKLPVLVDGDNGYGDEKSVARTIRRYESMGAAAILLEDQDKA